MNQIARNLADALEPFVNAKDQFPQSIKLINPKLGGFAPVTITVTKAQYLAALHALKEARNHDPR